MNTLPPDIHQQIDADFPLPDDREQVAAQLASLEAMPLNVGDLQLARAILVIAEGNMETITTLFRTNFGGDPRDVIVAAMEKSGNRLNWGLEPFSQADKE